MCVCYVHCRYHIGPEELLSHVRGIQRHYHTFNITCSLKAYIEAIVVWPFPKINVRLMCVAHGRQQSHEHHGVSDEPRRGGANQHTGHHWFAALFVWLGPVWHSYCTMYRTNTLWTLRQHQRNLLPLDTLHKVFRETVLSQCCMNVCWTGDLNSAHRKRKMEVTELWVVALYVIVLVEVSLKVYKYLLLGLYLCLFAKWRRE